MEKKHRLNKWEAQHKRNIARYEKQITELFREAVRETASITPLLANFSPDKPFSFDDYPITQQRVDELLKQLKNGVESVIANGVRSEWTLANNKNNELCNQVFGDNIGALTHEQYERYYSTNPQAVEAFINRKEQGLNLSDRVWRYTDQFKEEIELGLDLGLREGLSADAMSRQLRSFLNHPDALFRRVRDEHGILRLSKAAKAFHPGRGVYRSAYKNARRLAATESNIAYRTADYERWQQLDFVVGIRVVLSNNHTLNGEPFYDICDRLSAPMGSKATKGRGCYPKTFKFTGWHPLCRCHTETILKTLDEMRADEARILAGEPVSNQSENSVDDVPQEFKDWIKENEERIERAKSLPYFIRDNFRNINIGKRFPEDLKILFNNYDNLENHSISHNVITPLTNAQKQRRTEIRQIAKTTIANKPMMIPILNRTATISNEKIKEWLNQPHKYIVEKNESLLSLEDLINNGEYIEYGVDKHDPTVRAHLIQVTIANENSWIVVRELNDGTLRIHSVSDNHSIINNLIRKKP